MDPWVEQAAAEIARAGAARARGAGGRLVAVAATCTAPRSARRCAPRCCPTRRTIERVPCSSPRPRPGPASRACTAPARKRVLLLGHVDTVVAHAEHRPLHARRRAARRLRQRRHEGRRRALDRRDARARPAARATTREVALLLVCDEEWRTAPLATSSASPAWTRACASRAASARRDGDDGVVVRRKAAGTIHVDRARPHRALGLRAGPRPQRAAGARPRPRRPSPPRHDPDGPAHLTAVPTVLRSGDAFNVVPGNGELFCDLRADELDAIEAVLDAIPAERRRRAAGGRADPPLAGHALRGRRSRRLLERASAALGRPIAPARPRRRERRQPLRGADPGHRRRPRPARRQGAQPRRVRARGVAAAARRGRAGGDRRRRSAD